MSDALANLFSDFDHGKISRRRLLQALGVVGVGAPVAAAFGQGQCMRKFGAPECDTTSIKPVFASTGWQTVALDHLTFEVADYQKEAAFYTALVGWKLRSDDGKQAVMDIGNWASVVFKQAAPGTFPDESAGRGGAAGGAGGAGGRGGRAPARAVVTGFCWGIAQWDAKKVAAALKARGLDPIEDNDGHGFQSFHVKDPDGWDVQISNGTNSNRRGTPANAKLAAPLPFESTGWKTIWLDHLSFNVSNYKESASFYTNLLGWKPTYDEGSQNELMIADIGDVIVRGGNILDPNFGKPRAGRGGRGRGGADSGAPAPAPAVAATPAPRRARIDHISFGISPWDTDGVAAELKKRGLTASIDTSTGDEIHVAQFKSYHTSTPNGYNLQLSNVTHDTRLELPMAVKPKPPA
ncbi:MAG TPA: VOC family protein [Gemmatimonadaceae bacterium]|jgi:catechol 2,3-dioxygenase-like lactoylglutathione lyase family enzyme